MASMGGKLESFHFSFGDADAVIIVDLPSNERIATRALARRLLDRIREQLEDIGSADDLDGVEDLLERGNGAARQVVVYEANHDLREVMAEIVAGSAV